MRPHSTISSDDSGLDEPELVVDEPELDEREFAGRA
jgi:hypothetical protein